MINKQPLHLAVFISGNGSNLQAIINAIETKQLHAKIAIVISNKKDAYGLSRAKHHAIPSVFINHLNRPREDFEKDMVNLLQPLQIDYIVLAGFMRRLSPYFVNHYPGKILNIHPSLLPKYKGLHTHEQALKNRDQEHGCSIHIVTEQLDDGPILAQTKIKIEPDDTLETLRQKVQKQEHLLYPKVLQQLYNKERP